MTSAANIVGRLRHVAVILDGNRRWARARGLDSLSGYQRGGDRVLDLLTWCEAVDGLDTVTLWPLSTENILRATEELDGLLRVIVDTTNKIADTRRWRIRCIGSLDRLPAPSADSLRRAACRTQEVTGRVVNIAVAYGGRDEIARAVRDLVRAHRAAGTVNDLAQGICPARISQYLDTAGQPDPDLVIRTSGERRLSGFMLWQTAYSEFYVCEAVWPEFTCAEFNQALLDYAARSRRFGQ